jgi:hypothetical protein
MRPFRDVWWVLLLPRSLHSKPTNAVGSPVGMPGLGWGGSEAFDRRSAPFANSAKGGAPSSFFWNAIKEEKSEPNRPI